MTPTSRDVEAGGLRFRLLDFGGDGPPLLFLHATGFHAWVWAPYARRFVARFRVLALDQRGHGASDKPATGYQWTAFGTDLAGVLEALGLDGVRAVGHSKGATAIAAAVAADTRRLAAAVLIDPVLFGAPVETEPVWDNPLAAGARRRRRIWTSRDGMFDALRPRPPFASWQEEFVRLYVDHGVVDRPDGQVELCCPPEIEAQVYAHAPAVDSLGFLERLAVPTLLLRGADSSTFREPTAADALRRLPAGRLHTVPGTGHFLPMERPDLVGDAIADFFASAI